MGYAVMLSLATGIVSVAAFGAVDVDALLGRMTVEEKIGQLVQFGQNKVGFVFSAEDQERGIPAAELKAGRIGSHWAWADDAKNRDARIAARASRLGIPVMAGRGVIHGSDTTFPIPLAESCAWNPELWRRTAEVTALEGRARGWHWAFAPMIDISPDARWGRISESPGQDPFLASLFAEAKTTGLQGRDGELGPRRMLACAKHYIGYGAAEGGRDYNLVEMGEDTFREVYLPPFAAAVRAGVGSIMPAFNSLNGVPCTTDRRLLSDILRGELGFGGIVVSDSNAIPECGPAGHRAYATEGEATLAAFGAGVDVDMNGAVYQRYLPVALAEGKIGPKALDAAVRRVLEAKARLGMFEETEESIAALADGLDRAANLDLAKESALQSAVLLKNEGGVLPITNRSCKVALLGAAMDSPAEMSGAWTVSWRPTEVTALKPALERLGVTVVYERGWDFRGGFDAEGVRRAVAEADVVIAAFGESVKASGEASSVSDISLGSNQREALAAVKAAGKPLVAVLFNGRPLAVPEIAGQADAVIEAWHLGSMAGAALADLITGAVEPVGRLTCDFPCATGACPRYYNRPDTGRPPSDGRFTSKYTDAPVEPSLWRFGEGRGYTTFGYSATKLDRGGATATATVTNTGRRAGTEIVQYYVRRYVPARVTARWELRDFTKIRLEPGESSEVRFRLTDGISEAVIAHASP